MARNAGTFAPGRQLFKIFMELCVENLLDFELKTAPFDPAMRPKHIYAKLEDESISSSQTGLVSQEIRRPWISLIATVIATAIFSSSLTIAIMTTLSPHGISFQQIISPPSSSHNPASTKLIHSPLPLQTHTPPTPRPNCGTTLTEAKSLNCTFDPLSVAWLPPDCPRDGTSEFIDFLGNGTKWKYWYDRAGTQEIGSPYELAHIGENGTYWTTQREHVTHCAFMMLRVHRAMEREDGRGDMLVRKYEHSRHCLMYLVTLARGENDERITTSGNVGFGDC
ncbi:hypothetical protein HYALB_00010202 [Hymenoscyphus albidus]|uniref:Uncharacterized protein n=1 Tax=Hymenoscyphus albidus TaxID=595503 RepID=A0A9N9Q1W8_9HELO|nr:hypothetical protein HYALB_00010202 [Hymenoscyphus albidus]